MQRMRVPGGGGDLLPALVPALPAGQPGCRGEGRLLPALPARYRPGAERSPLSPRGGVCIPCASGTGVFMGSSLFLGSGKEKEAGSHKLTWGCRFVIVWKDEHSLSFSVNFAYKFIFLQAVVALLDLPFTVARLQLWSDNFSHR